MVDYFPLEPGAKRIMRVHQRLIAGKDTTETTQVRPVEVVQGERDIPGLGKVRVVEAPRDSGPSNYTFFRKQDDGVMQLLPGREGKPPMEMLYLMLPLAKGLKWYDTKAQREMMEVTAKESVTVDAGSYPDCFEVVVTSTKMDWSMRQWLAPNIGAVRWENKASWVGKDGVNRQLIRTGELVEYQVPAKKQK